MACSLYDLRQNQLASRHSSGLAGGEGKLIGSK
jgi:hypothetical protein